MKLHELRQQRRRILIRLAITIVFISFLGYLVYDYIGLSHTVAYPLPVAFKLIKQPNTDGYIKSIHSYFTAHPFEQFLFSVNDVTLSAAVTKDHAEVDTVTPVRDASGLGFAIGLRQPLIVWKTSHGQFYIDSHGTSFMLNDFAEPTLQVTDNSGISAETSGTVVSSRFISFLGQMVAAINGHQMGEVVAITIPPNTTRELDVRLKGRDYDIKTNIDRDPLKQAADIASALRFMDGRGIHPQYVDARVEGKAFY
ncbi:MAG TPA: hypothetical protein VH144_03550, partial [Candidatus Saccharimonadales bacterium]|nr:hypothetical protein [Candidatus Saccharimonadales bacterium]